MPKNQNMPSVRLSSRFAAILRRKVYYGTITDLRSATKGQLCAVAVTKERNCHVVWYGHADVSDDTLEWAPAPTEPLYWGASGRDRAIERAVMDVAKIHAERHHK